MSKLQETFDVIRSLACNGIQNPYWKEGWVYPTPNIAQPSNTTTATGTKATASTASPTPGIYTPGSYGLGKGDGYNGACCKDQSDCWDDCLSDKCNGPANTKTTAATTTASDSASATATSSTFDDSTLTADLLLSA